MAKTGETCSEACLDWPILLRLVLLCLKRSAAYYDPDGIPRHVSTKGQIALCYPASEPARELVRELVCDLLASWRQTWFPTCRRQVRAISTCRDSSNLVPDRFAAGLRPARELVCDMLASCWRAASEQDST